MGVLKQFREKMDSGISCIGPSITLKDPFISEALGPESDFLWIDAEHSPMSIESVTGHLLAARACNKPALVRVPGSATESIKPVLDSGVDGIIVPQVTGVDEVRKVVADCRYPPLGRRGFGPRTIESKPGTSRIESISRTASTCSSIIATNSSVADSSK